MEDLNKEAKKYITSVVQQAYESEGRNAPRGDIKVAITLVNGGKKYLHVYAGSEYLRVRRRIAYRLNNNLIKNFPFLLGRFDTIDAYDGKIGNTEEIIEEL